MPVLSDRGMQKSRSGRRCSGVALDSIRVCRAEAPAQSTRDARSGGARDVMVQRAGKLPRRGAAPGRLPEERECWS